jgi:hypothetical protein
VCIRLSTQLSVESICVLPAGMRRQLIGLKPYITVRHGAFGNMRCEIVIEK